MNKLLTFLILFILFFQQLDAKSLHLNVQDFGAVSDTNLLSTKAFQKAIDKCYFNPDGGVVYVPAGDYKLGTIVLKKGTTLFIDSGATIWASKNINDYRMPLEETVRPVLIYANGAENIAIDGKGTINGQARHVYKDLKKIDQFIANITENAEKAGVEMKRYYIKRPDVSLINLVNSKHVHLRTITVINSPFWSVHLALCDEVIIDGMSVYSSLEKGVNSDGIDINSCSNVKVINCLVSTGDDGIVIKSKHDKPAENILVKHCTVSSSSSALKIGTESYGDFRNIKFDSCSILNTNRGLCIVVNEDGTAENITFSNIEMNCTRRHFNWWGNADPIWIYIYQKFDYSQIGKIKNIYFQNIKSDGMGTSKVESAVGDRIENLFFENVEFNLYHEDYPDKRATDALYIEHVNGLSLKDVSINWIDEKNNYWQSGLSLSNVSNVDILNLKAESGNLNPDFPAILIDNTSQLRLNSFSTSGSDCYRIKITGNQTSSIFLPKSTAPFVESDLDVSTDQIQFLE